MADKALTSLEKIQTRMTEVKDLLLPLTDTSVDLSDEQSEQFRSLTAEWNTLEAAERKALDDAQIQTRKSEAADLLARWQPLPGNISKPTDTGGFNINVLDRANPWDRDELSRNLSVDEIVSRALSAAEHTEHTSDDRREALTRMIESGGDRRMADLVLRTTSPDYKSAFGELVRNGGNVAMLSHEQRQAIDFAEPVAALHRAQATSSDGAGGYLIPTDIEPSITLTAAGTTNPVWSLGRRVQTAGNTYRVVGAPNAAWSWDAQNAEVSDDAVTFTATDIPLYSANGFIPVSIEATRSIDGIMDDVQRVLGGGWNDLVGAALTTGSGSSQPTGIITALIGTSSEVETAAITTYAIADVYSTHEKVAARHRRNASWMMNMVIINETRQFDTAGGAGLLARLGDGTPDRLLGRPLYENPDMDSDSGTGGKEIAVFGDFSNYVIAEGIGTLVEIIPHVFGGNGRPIGARGVFAKTRIGADSVNDGAFGLLQVRTS